MAVFAPSVILQQPQSTPLLPLNSNQWSTGICDCFDECNVCCFATWCFPVFACSTAYDFGECFCLPMLDYLSCSLHVPLISLALRAAVRNRYGIQGDLATDCLYSTFCNVCSWCQIAREIKRRRAPCTIVNAQTALITAPPVATATCMAVLPSQATMITHSVTTNRMG
ncbi:placenta-specific gene 8 protein-like [Pangasianodon hypophthalmus]|uniref:placenta-specific gene 8 protein-like n=1 Tax=Pangasianodon hypophthalmus TaxID=310915 RepID=UPI000F000967|nr:placenta-specific gene 8 protein-like [Pangasianodon hypophthalmus]